MVWICIFSWEQSFSFVLQSSGQWQLWWVLPSTVTLLAPGGNTCGEPWPILHSCRASRCFFLTGSSALCWVPRLTGVPLWQLKAPFYALWCTKMERASLSPRSSPFPTTTLQIRLCVKLSFLFTDSPVIGITWSLSAQMLEVLWNHGKLASSCPWLPKGSASGYCQQRGLSGKLILRTSVVCCCHRKRSEVSKAFAVLIQGYALKSCKLLCCVATVKQFISGEKSTKIYRKSVEIAYNRLLRPLGWTPNRSPSLNHGFEITSPTSLPY